MTEQNQLGLKVQVQSTGLEEDLLMLSGMFSNREISRRRLSDISLVGNTICFSTKNSELTLAKSTYNRQHGSLVMFITKAFIVDPKRTLN